MLNPNDTGGTLELLWNRTVRQSGIHLTKKAETTHRLDLIATVEYPRESLDGSSDSWALNPTNIQLSSKFRSLRKCRSSQILSDEEEEFDAQLMPPPKSQSHFMSTSFAVVSKLL